MQGLLTDVDRSVVIRCANRDTDSLVLNAWPSLGFALGLITFLVSVYLTFTASLCLSVICRVSSPGCGLLPLAIWFFLLLPSSLDFYSFSLPAIPAYPFSA